MSGTHLNDIYKTYDILLCNGPFPEKSFMYDI